MYHRCFDWLERHRVLAISFLNALVIVTLLVLLGAATLDDEKKTAYAESGKASATQREHRARSRRDRDPAEPPVSIEARDSERESWRKKRRSRSRRRADTSRRGRPDAVAPRSVELPVGSTSYGTAREDDEGLEDSAFHAQAEDLPEWATTGRVAD